MPYTVRKSGGKYQVVKKDGDPHVFGTHPSPQEAYKQIAAIEASEGMRSKKKK